MSRLLPAFKMNDTQLLHMLKLTCLKHTRHTCFCRYKKGPDSGQSEKLGKLFNPRQRLEWTVDNLKNGSLPTLRLGWTVDSGLSKKTRVGHRVLLRSECIVLLKNAMFFYILLRSFFRFLSTCETPKNCWVLLRSFPKNVKKRKERNVLLQRT